MSVRYQVFVSSTFRDLEAERREVIQALLELDCIPAAMEMFPASNADQWTLIKGVIDNSDYFIVIVGGRYGSVDENGVSYTEKEYDYALEIGKPILGFVHEDIEDLKKRNIEPTEAGLAKLASFRAKVEMKMCKKWSTPQELGGAVSRSLIQLMRSEPGVGYVRGSEALTKERLQEIDDLRKRLAEYDALMRSSEDEAPKGAEGLAHGTEHFTISASVGNSINSFDVEIEYTWDEIFRLLGPLLMDESSEANLSKYLGRDILASLDDDVFNHTVVSRTYALASVHGDDFQQIKIQLFSLGLIEQSVKKRAVSDKGSYWQLTPYGQRALMKLRALPTKNPATKK